MRKRQSQTADVLAPAHDWLIAALAGNLEHPRDVQARVFQASGRDAALDKALSILNYIHAGIVEGEAGSKREYESELSRSLRPAATSMRRTATQLSTVARNLAQCLAESYERDPSNFRSALTVAHRAHSLGSARLSHLLAVGGPAHEKGRGALHSEAKRVEKISKLPSSDKRFLAEIAKVKAKRPDLPEREWQKLYAEHYGAKDSAVRKRLGAIKRTRR